MRRVLAAAIAAALGVVVLVPNVALASWTATGGGAGASRARAMPAGNTPATVVEGRNVTVSWPHSSFPDGATVNYLIKRYDASSGTEQAVGAGCSGPVTGSSCTEAAVPPGSWRYSVTTRRNLWIGAESAWSTAANVGSAALSFSSSTTVTSLPATLEGDIANFITGQTVTFRLDDPATGTPLTGAITPSPVASSGSAQVSVTIPDGTSNGSHTVYAIGSEGDVAAADITVDVPDSRPPTVRSSVVAKTAGGIAGYIKQGGTYYVYANIADLGDPSSGVASATANVDSITTGQSAAPLTSGSYSVGGTSYNYRSASLTANTKLAAGTYSYSITATDGVGNSGTTSGFSVVVDNTAPSASDIQTANAGTTVGRAEAGDSMTFTYSEVIEPSSILGGWTGSSTTVTVRITDSGSTDDYVTVWDSGNTVRLPLVGVDLNGNYTGSASATFTGSTMVQDGASITVTLGTAGGDIRTAGSAAKMRWYPSSSVTDRAGNACLTKERDESGVSDKEF